MVTSSLCEPDVYVIAVTYLSLLYFHHLCTQSKVKSCDDPLRLGTVIILVSSGIDFVNTQLLYSDRATR